MAEPAFQLRVVTDEGTVLDREVVSVVAPGEIGYLGILANHASLLTTLTAGRLTYRTADGTTHQRPVTGGLLEVHQNRVTVLASS
ncbi:MAG: ATP synthase F1 subunit epsilon [Candidatus Omnitrophica bacterium]|nr:ATP synthase F1 subunit epsilon [Candidatus Omnitrophota bacterium]